MTEDDWTASLTKGPGLKIWATMGAAFRSFPGLVRALPFFIVWTIVLISAADVLLVNGLYEVGIREFDAGLGGVIYAFCFLVVSTFFGSPLLIAVHRRIIVGSNPDQGYFASFFSQTFLWFWLTALGIGVLRLAHPRLTFGVLDISGFSQPILILVVLVLFVVPLVLSVIAVRFGIILPAIAIGGPNASLKAAWIGLREVYMRVWLGALGIFFTFAILYRLIEKFGPDPESSYLMFMVYMGLWDFVVVLNLMVAASFMSHVFLRCPQELTRSRLPLEGGSGEV